MRISKKNKPPLFGKKTEQKVDSGEKNKLTQDLEHLTEEHQNRHGFRLTCFVGVTDFADIARHDDLAMIQPDYFLTKILNGSIIMRNE